MFFTIPGIGGSGPAHWQSVWERAEPGFVRIDQDDWDRPDRARWADRALAALDATAGPIVLVAHSLGCLLVPWLDRGPAAAAGRIAGAFLVAVPDPDGPAFPAEAASFRDVPAGRLSFPVLVVASADDPFGSTGHARSRACGWGGAAIEIGPRGHINADSGLGDWAEGRRYLECFRAGLRR